MKLVAGRGSDDTPTHPRESPVADDETLAALLGGRQGAADATLPSIAFVIGWLVVGHSIGWGAAGALGTGLVLGGWRLRQGSRPRAVLVGLLGVGVAALVALHTGRAADFFLVQIVTNATSALAWAVSIVLRWPLLGLVVGGLLRQRLAWRRDPDLLRAYGRASWVWAAQYVVRVAVLVPLWYAGQTVALAIARLALTWPLIAACLAVSWWVLRRSLPPEHPGLRHPVTG